MTRTSEMVSIKALVMLNAALIAGGVPACPTDSKSCSRAEHESVQSPALLQASLAAGLQRKNPDPLQPSPPSDPGHRVLHLAKSGKGRKSKRGGGSDDGGSDGGNDAGIPAEMQEILDFHNMFRCMHNVPLMTWDETIAANAQAWADAGHYGHSSSEERTLDDIGYVGENLAWGYPTRSGRESVEAWYDEIMYTDGTPVDCNDKNADAAAEQICHYTQVVWQSSTKLGCGKGIAEVEFPGVTYSGDFWVCQYGPGGNYGGEFVDNVLAPVKTADECKDL